MDCWICERGLSSVSTYNRQNQLVYFQHNPFPLPLDIKHLRKVWPSENLVGILVYKTLQTQYNTQTCKWIKPGLYR